MGTKIDLNEFKKLNKEVDTLSKRFENLKLKGDINEELGIKETSRQMRKLDIDTENTYRALAKAKDSLRAFREQHNLGDLNYEESIEQLKDLNDTAKKSVGIFEKVGKRIKGLALRVFIFSQIAKAFRSMLNAMKEGLQNLAQYSKEYNSVMSAFKSQTATLKNALATAFAPIIEMVVPYLTKLCEWLTIACDNVSRFFAILQGKSTFTKATKQAVDYADSLKTANKEMNKLASFDDINVLQSDSSSGGTDASKMFEEVDIDESDFKWITWIRENLDLIKTVAEGIGVAFLSWKIGQGIVAFFTMLGSDAFPIALIVGGLVAIGLALKEMAEKGEMTNKAFLLLEGGILAVGTAISLFVGWWALIPTAIAMVVVAIVKYKDQIADAFTNLFKKLKDKFNAFKKDIKDGLSSFKSWLDRVGKAIGEGFVEKMTQMKNGIKKILNGIATLWIKMVNGIKSAINFMIDCINAISFDMPEFMGGGHIGFDIQKIALSDLPQLATGGITNRPTTALIGESGREAVLPLENNTEWMDVLANKIGNNNVTIKFDGSLSQLARVLNPILDAESSRIGTRLIVN